MHVIFVLLNLFFHCTLDGKNLHEQPYSCIFCKFQEQGADFTILQEVKEDDGEREERTSDLY